MSGKRENRKDEKVLGTSRVGCRVGGLGGLGESFDPACHWCRGWETSWEVAVIPNVADGYCSNTY